jgi:hypothetical protein
MPGGPMAKNRMFRNNNPNLGGVQWSKGTNSLVFGKAVNMTPDHSYGSFVIPWDSKSGDYVYGCCPQKVFKKKLSLQVLKNVSFNEL